MAVHTVLRSRHGLAGWGALLLASTSLAAVFPSGSVLAQDAETVIEALNQMSVRGIRKHQEAFQEIADRNDGNRSAATSGYDESVTYVKGTLEEVGYEVTIQSFEFIVFNQLGPSTLEQTAPDSVVYKELEDETEDEDETGDYALLDQTDAGDVSGAATGVDLALDDPASSTSGCEAEDFEGFPEGNIALMQRGTCTFKDKAENAAAAGAVGAIIFNQGDDETAPRQDVFIGTLSAEYSGGIPVVSTSFELGSEFAGIEGLTLRIVADSERVPTTTDNVLAERPGSAPDDAPVIVMGGHLDSVPEGAGINDNGSGSAMILEVARLAAEADIVTDNRIRYAWWGAEEAGLIGSTFYVDALTEEEAGEIALNLNFDMIGSPNFVRFVYDGDGSDTEDGDVGSAESGLIEALFLEHFANADLPVEPTAFDGRSDYFPFVSAGIPAGGVFSGAGGVKTEEQAETYGGTAGEPYDPCYHTACDNFDNNNNEVLTELARASATVLAILAFEELPLVAPTSVAATARSAKEAASAADQLEYRGSHLVR